MSEQQFLEYMAENDYVNVRIKNFKTKDHVWFSTPDKNTAQVILRKGVFIREMDPKDYPEIAMTRLTRLLFWWPTFWEITTGIASMQPFKVSTYSLDCSRCNGKIRQGKWAFPGIYTDEIGEDHELIICWDCDHDLMNGGDPFTDQYDIWQERNERRQFL